MAGYQRKTALSPEEVLSKAETVIPARIGLKKSKGSSHGGSFTVGGRGGTDNNLVQFNASRGERVSVTPPGQSGGPVIQVINNTPVKTREERSTGPRGEDIRRACLAGDPAIAVLGYGDACRRGHQGGGSADVEGA